MENIGEKIFLIITANHYPKGDAGAVRLQAFANIFLSLGYKPVVIGMGESTNFRRKENENISFYSLRYEKRTYLFRIIGRLLYKRNLKRVLSNIPSDEVRGILIDSGNRASFKLVEQYARGNQIPLYYDSVEWYSPCEFKLGKLNISYRNNNNLNCKIIDKKYKVISISTYLEKHFCKRGIETIRIPVIMGVTGIPHEKVNQENDTIKIVYAGSIGNKDHIDEMIEAISLLGEQERSKLRFCVIGITQDEYEKKYGKIKLGLAEQTVFFMGRISRAEVLEELGTADFSFLLRPIEERYAKAGFPTKVVEGLSTGTPILCNHTSDLSMYLEDGRNSIIIEECTVEGCVKALRKVLSCSRDNITRMQIEARSTAEKYFDWRNYLKIMEDFLA